MKKVLNDVGSFSLCFEFYKSTPSDSLKTQLSTADVEFNGYEPCSDICKKSLGQHSLLMKLLDLSSSSSLPGSGSFSKIIHFMQAALDDLFSALRECVLEKHTKAFGEVDMKNVAQECAGWSAEKSLDVYDGWQDTVRQLEVLRGTDCNAPMIKTLKEALKILKDQKLDASLPPEEQTAKNVLMDAISSLKGMFPDMTLKQIGDAPLEELRTKICSQKGLGEAVSSFFKALQSCDSMLSRFGKSIHVEVEDCKTKSRILIAVQSGVIVLQKNDPAKAASFESERLKHHGITLDELPGSLAVALRSLASGAQKVQNPQKKKP